MLEKTDSVSLPSAISGWEGVVFKGSVGLLWCQKAPERGSPFCVLWKYQYAKTWSWKNTPKEELKLKERWIFSLCTFLIKTSFWFIDCKRPEMGKVRSTCIIGPNVTPPNTPCVWTYNWQFQAIWVCVCVWPVLGTQRGLLQKLAPVFWRPKNKNNKQGVFTWKLHEVPWVQSIYPLVLL